ncbi:Probable indole-3-acetic acid-amido synthetase GH3.1 [Striga hermonthica]|uniref:Probable indole-3-acetic acid-amido synthetase GH3.1 n=1 Tax=Striga hermonthica TaxID=68872 RepID=A0A9N7N0R0_STRHE|nr:Probable indole-3-acetic acid-amido synthetase GH3.1 [Striga hermonthica]
MATNSISSFSSSSSSSLMSPPDLQLIEDMTRQAEEVQQNVLSQILTQNAETEYLKGLGLDGATDIETFKSKVPVVTYEDIRLLIRKMADGDPSSILCAQPITEFIFSSGTTAGVPKLIPSTDEERDRRMHLVDLITPVMNQYIKGLTEGKVLYFTYARPELITEGGIPARSAITSLYKSATFITRQSFPYSAYTSPNEAILCLDTHQSTYAQLLCGLYEREQVLSIGASFASTLLLVIKFLELNWKHLAQTIRAGFVDPNLMTHASTREVVSRTMRPDPDLADLITRECASSDWEGIIIRIWPNARYLDVIATGPMAQYIPTLNHYSGGLPIASTIYVSSECFLGINLNPLRTPPEASSYTLMPHMAYFEFLPHGGGGEGPIDLVNVELGKEYEVVVTTRTGLYRYRMGDVLRVSGFHNRAPEFMFVGRKSVLSSVNGEKVDEAELQAAVEEAAAVLARECGTGLVDYTSRTDNTVAPGHYIVYWELQEKGSQALGDVLARCCLTVEESFNWVYRMLRAADKSIGPLEIRVVRMGSFSELMEQAISRGASLSQYKVPRCVRSKEMVDLLDSRVVSTHFSPSMPHWSLKTPI